MIKVEYFIDTSKNIVFIWNIVIYELRVSLN